MVHRAFGCLMLFLLLTGGCGGSEERARPASGPRLTTSVARDLDAKLREKVKDTGVPGASAAVVFPDGRVWEGAAGVAVLEPRRPMTSQTSLPFASVTKIATAALAMRLVEQGRLKLDDPIRRWYPAWRGDLKATIRDLLGHTAGLGDPPDAFFERLGSRGAATPRQFIAATPKPGPRTTDAEYSNTGFIMAGLILARAAGRPVAAAMRHELFAHPGGDGLAFQPAEHPHPPLAHCYWYPDGALDPVDASDGSRLLPARGEATTAFTAGALAGDVPSLARWSHELLSGRILEPDSLREMTRFHDGAFWGGYGLGLARAPEGEHELWGHGGEITGSVTELWHLPSEHLTIAITWNDNLLSGTGAGFLPALLRAALGAESES
jgi:CubicO group peptidase (beta-lactamase class C family)